MDTESEPGFIQKYNIIIGILLCAVFPSILLTILPYGIIFLGDIYLVIGCCFGLYFTFKYRKESQSHVKTGIIVGLTGSALSLILVSIFVALVYAIDFFLFLLALLVSIGIMSVFVGLILGYLFGYYFRNKEGAPRESSRF